jgi:hypothetical protein
MVTGVKLNSMNNMLLLSGFTALAGPLPPLRCRPIPFYILGSGRLFLLGFSTIVVLQDGVVSPMPNPQPGGPGLRIYDPRRQGGPAIPPGTGYSF